jgi:hypothetical protein
MGEEIFADRSQHGRAVLTSDGASLCDHLDKSRALATMMLTGLIGSEVGRDTNEERFIQNVDDRLAHQVQRLRDERANRFRSGVFLLFEVSGECSQITPQYQRDCGSFVLALDGVPKRDIRDRHEPSAACG